MLNNITYDVLACSRHMQHKILMSNFFLVVGINDAAEMLEVPRRPIDTIHPNIRSLQALLTMTQF